MAGVKPENIKNNFLTKLTGFFFTNWKLTLVLWVFILSLGTAAYTTYIKREGFPPIQFPISFVGGQYPGQSMEVVDEEIVKPLSEALVAREGITDVDASASVDGSFTMAVLFDDTLNSIEGTEIVNTIIFDEVGVSEDVIIRAVAIDPGKFLFDQDLVLHVYSSSASIQQLDAGAIFVAERLTELSTVEVATPLVNIKSLQDGRMIETNFTKVGVSSADSDEVPVFNATAIGVKKVGETDLLELSKELNQELAAIDLESLEGDLRVVASADFADDVNSQIEFLESNLLTSLLAVSFVSLLLISWRASIITAIFMITVMLATILILWLIGYTLNVITLFALILSLGLFVDDATIVVEAIDVNKRNRRLKPLEVAKHAISKVGTASFAGTLTTILVFAILASPSGILGEFIRLIPVTVMIALLVSFILSITLIPFLSKFIMLRNRDRSWFSSVNPVLKSEEWLSVKAEKVILKTRKRSGKIYGAFAVLLSIVLLMTGMYIFGFKVDNNTFPPAKDTDQLGIAIQFDGLKSVEEARELTDQLDEIIDDSIGEFVVFSYYGIEQLPDAQQATIIVDLVPFTDRETKAPEISATLEQAIEEEFSGPALITVTAVDNGPPSSAFPFGIRIYSEDVEVLRSATQKTADTFEGVVLENYNGDQIEVLSSKIDGVEDEILRDNGRRYAITRFSYDSENPTLVSLLTEAEFKEIYSEEEVEEAFGVPMSNIEFDAGQEGDFQDSFNTLLLAIPIALFLMYSLLAVQFRSFVQPFLILLAVPFTIFGVAVGLYLTDNAASFFALVGFVGLTGIAVNNTIMLTDYANQERRRGMGSVESIAAATKKRLRPLIATTVTTVVALLPLALSDPFWEALAFTIIFGLISSTIMVLLAFPYYYLAAEWIRMRSSRTTRRIRKIVRPVKQEVKKAEKSKKSKAKNKQ